MIVSNEPGYYKPGSFGVRIENLLEIVDSGMSNETLGRRYGHKIKVRFCTQGGSQRRAFTLARDSYQ